MVKSADKYSLFLTDIETEWWMTCASLQLLDSMELSSPCQPWSAAGGGRCLESQEGWVTISGFVNAALLKPKIVLMENVSAIVHHKHWPIIQQVASRCGYEIIEQRLINMPGISPQSFYTYS